MESYLTSIIGLVGSAVQVDLMLELVSLNDLILSESAMDLTVVIYAGWTGWQHLISNF